MIWSNGPSCLHVAYEEMTAQTAASSLPPTVKASFAKLTSNGATYLLVFFVTWSYKAVLEYSKRINQLSGGSRSRNADTKCSWGDIFWR